MKESLILYSTANDPQTAIDLQNGPQMILDRPQMIPNMDRKRSREKFTNGMDLS